MSTQLQSVGRPLPNPVDLAGPFFQDLSDKFQHAFPKKNRAKPKRVHLRPAFASMSMPAFPIAQDSNVKTANSPKKMAQETAIIAAAKAKKPEEKKSLNEILNNAGKIPS